MLVVGLVFVSVRVSGSVSYLLESHAWEKRQKGRKKCWKRCSIIERLGAWTSPTQEGGPNGLLRFDHLPPSSTLQNWGGNFWNFPRHKNFKSAEIAIPWLWNFVCNTMENLVYMLRRGKCWDQYKYTSRETVTPSWVLPLEFRGIGHKHDTSTNSYPHLS